MRRPVMENAHTLRVSHSVIARNHRAKMDFTVHTVLFCLY